MKSTTLARFAVLAMLAACGDDEGSEETPPTPDLQVTGRVLDEAGNPMNGARAMAFIVGFPSEATAVTALSAPTCDEAIVPEGLQPEGEDVTGSDGAFTIDVLELESARCLIVKLRPAGASDDANVGLAPRLVSPAQIPPANVQLGDLSIGMLD
jgi:hypothetical protein